MSMGELDSFLDSFGTIVGVVFIAFVIYNMLGEG